jgi:hypothetical protein
MIIVTGVVTTVCSVRGRMQLRLWKADLVERVGLGRWEGRGDVASGVTVLIPLANLNRENWDPGSEHTEWDERLVYFSDAHKD